ncbi:MAG: Xylulose kinase [Phycisphaerae bacterium]|nr:Xylulose kinase [Phycisphaerae bacterium]
MGSLLGLDLGTTNVKALLCEQGGQVLGVEAAPVAIEHLPGGAVEQDIEDIWKATLAAIGRLGAKHDLSAVRAVGLSAQGGAVQLADAAGRPTAPVISWLDARGRIYDHRLQEEVGRAWLTEHNGHGRSGTAVGQLLRLGEQSPALIAAPRRVGFVGDAICQRLCGRAAHDATSLSLCFLYNPRTDDYDGELLEKVGLKRGQLPDLLKADEAAGGLQETVARLTGLPAGVPVTPAIHDQYAAAVGCGAVHAGDVMFGAGTAWVLLAVTKALADPIAGAAFVCRHPAPGLYGQMLSVNNGGSSLSWARRMLRLEDLTDEQLDKLIESAPRACEGLRFWPLLALSGAGLKPGTGGRLDNIHLAHTPAHVLRAVVEGLACELARYIGFIRASGVALGRLVMCGRAAGSRVTPQIIADTVHLPIACASERETSALGAAIVARRLVEPKSELARLAEAMAPRVREVHPDAGADTYRELLRQYVASLPMA